MRKLKYIYSLKIFFVLCLCLLNTSCASKKSPEFASELRRPGAEIGGFEGDYYIIGEDDALEIDVWKTLSVRKAEEAGEEESEYLINQGDTLDISVWQWPDLTTGAIVRPDGKISFPLVGDITAAGKTLTELDNEITEKLLDFIKSPEVSIMITGFGVAELGIAPDIAFAKIEDLSSKETVAPDGNIYLPLVGAVRASGLTLNQLRHRVKEKVNKYVDNPEVSITIKTFGGKKIIVLGEVNDPGVYRSYGKIKIVELIALAGGYTQDAVLRSVMLVRGDLDNPEIRTIDVNAAIKKGDRSQNIEVEPQDIVYVPKTFIADFNYFLEQLLGPMTSSTSAIDAIKAIRIGPSPKK